MKKKIVATLLLTASMLANANVGNLATQQVCKETGIKPPLTGAVQTAWWNPSTLLSRSLDRKVLKREIIAYKIQWSTGWSGWFVKGVNDLDGVTTVNGVDPSNTDNRLMWVYFGDHNFKYIYCSVP